MLLLAFPTIGCMCSTFRRPSRFQWPDSISLALPLLRGAFQTQSRSQLAKRLSRLRGSSPARGPPFAQAYAALAHRGTPPSRPTPLASHLRAGSADVRHYARSHHVHVCHCIYGDITHRQGRSRRFVPPETAKARNPRGLVHVPTVAGWSPAASCPPVGGSTQAPAVARQPGRTEARNVNSTDGAARKVEQGCEMEACVRGLGLVTSWRTSKWFDISRLRRG